MLTLGVCLVGDGHLFVKKQPVCYWDIAGLAKDIKKKVRGGKALSDDHYKSSPRYNVDRPLYPTRVINTHTYEFEDDALLYHNNYAILSHTWTKKGKEVEYPDAKEFLLQLKKEHLHAMINKKNKELTDAKHGGKDTGAEIKALQDELVELEKKLSLRKESTQKQTEDAHNPGRTKLAKAISVARAQKFTYLWVDNCCIDKKNNTELVEAISSMGDWYKNAKVCILFLFRFCS